ncbi:hypoxanthine phosphoribosyltransferase [Candidatus Saccharibacteria bacterium]|nr:hypoxanthine phosphoribosyltransferase [Candidatus Saccharibacteria bacterium]
MKLRLEGGDNYISAAEISRRVNEIGSYLTKKFGDQEIVAITMMNGAKVFATDLTRAIKNPNILDDNLRVSSYNNTESTGEVKFHYDLSVDIRGHDILVIEDILDTGTTLSSVIPELWKSKPKSITLVCMFEKPSKRLPDTEIKVNELIIGMKIADKFILGYGLDWKDPNGLSRYRNLPFVTIAEFTKKDGIDWAKPKRSSNN